MTLGVTGDPIHPGSWFGLPDLGITEKLSPNRTSEGGSNIVGGGTVARTTGGVTSTGQQALYSPPLWSDMVKGAQSTSSVLGADTQNTQQTPTNTQTSGSPLGGEADFNVGGRTFSSMEDYNKFMDSLRQQGFGNMEEYNKAIDDTYNPQYDYLNKVESSLRSDYPNVLAEAQSQYNTNQAMLGNNRQSSLNDNTNQLTSGQKRTEDALSAARRLYDDIIRGGKQRFGGLSSAGQAVYELAGREAQKQFGSIRQGFNDLAQTLEQKKGEIEDNYNTGMLQLKQNYQSATNEAQRNFQNKLMEIESNRSQLGAAKAQARLQALQELKQNVYAINMQSAQFAQTLQQMKYQQQLNIDAYKQTTGSAIAGGANALNSYNNLATTNPTSALSTLQKGQTLQAPIPVGQIGKSIVGKDELGRYIYSDNTRGWGGFAQG